MEKTYVVTFEPWVIEAKDEKEAEKLANKDLKKGIYPNFEEIYEEKEN